MNIYINILLGIRVKYTGVLRIILHDIGVN